jgi:CBS domain-containing protein
MMDFPEAPTLRLRTLRMLLRRTPAPQIFDAWTPVEDIALVLQGGGTAVIVDDSNVLCGTLTLDDVASHDPHLPAAELMQAAPLVLLPEEDPEVARVAMSRTHTDRIAVADHRGELLGILSAQDLEAA